MYREANPYVAKDGSAQEVLFIKNWEKFIPDEGEIDAVLVQNGPLAIIIINCLIKNPAAAEEQMTPESFNFGGFFDLPGALDEEPDGPANGLAWGETSLRSVVIVNKPKGTKEAFEIIGRIFVTKDLIKINTVDPVDLRLH